MGKHGDLTDEEIAFWPRVLGDDPFRDEHRVIVRAVAEIRRHRAVQTASAERVREVVRLIAQEEIAGENCERGTVIMRTSNAIADRVAAQLTALPPGHVCPVPYGLGPDDLDVLSELAVHAEMSDWPRARAVLEQIIAMHRAPGSGSSS